MVLQKGNEAIEINIFEIRSAKMSRRNKRDVTKVTLYDGRKIFVDTELSYIRRKLESAYSILEDSKTKTGKKLAKVIKQVKEAEKRYIERQHSENKVNECDNR